MKAIQTSAQLRNLADRMASPNASRVRSSYDVVKFDEKCVWIVDTNSALSVTNDAERVCVELALHYGGRRIIYRDSTGAWDELVHDCGRFERFAPAIEMAL